MCEGGIADMAHVADMAGVEATLAARAAQTCLVDANPVQPPVALMVSREERRAMAWSVPVAKAVQSMASVAGQDKGEKSRSLSSSSSQRSSTSLRRFLVIFAGGNRISGEEGSGGMGDGCVIAGEDTSLLTGATATGEGDCTGASHAAVVAYPCC